MLAIIIPYYKLTFFKETLQSLANQTNKQFKVYIGDDASPQNPNTLLNIFKGEFNFEYYRFETNLGGTNLVKQWERCIELISDESWIMILGDDDYLEPNTVEAFLKNIKTFSTTSNVVRFASRVINQQFGTISKPYTHPIWEKATDSFFRKIKEETRSSLSEYIFKTEIYKRYKFNNFPLAWYSDDMAWIEFSENKLIYSINESHIFIRNSNENISGKKDNLAKKTEAKILFYKQLVTNYFNRFSNNQKAKLLFNLEITLKYQNQLNEKNQKFLASKYIKNRLFFSFVKFFGRRLNLKHK